MKGTGPPDAEALLRRSSCIVVPLLIVPLVVAGWVCHPYELGQGLANELKVFLSLLLDEIRLLLKVSCDVDNLDDASDMLAQAAGISHRLPLNSKNPSHARIKGYTINIKNRRPLT